MICSLVQRHIDAYVDGELDPGAMLELERHLEACACCQERVNFEGTYRAILDTSIGSVTAPASLSERVRASLAEADSTPRLGMGIVKRVRLPVRQVAPLAAAAGILLAVGGAISGVPSGVSEASATPIFEDVVRVHSAELPADVQARAPQQVTHYFRGKVAFPVRPVVFGRSDVRLLGGRVSNVRAQRAAAVYYDVRGHRVTVVVFDSPALADGALRMRFGGQDFLYRDVHGYTVPVRQYNGLNYAFTGDLDREQMMRLAASARLEP